MKSSALQPPQFSGLMFKPFKLNEIYKLNNETYAAILNYPDNGELPKSDLVPLKRTDALIYFGRIDDKFYRGNLFFSINLKTKVVIDRFESEYLYALYINEE